MIFSLLERFKPGIYIIKTWIFELLKAAPLTAELSVRNNTCQYFMCLSIGITWVTIQRKTKNGESRQHLNLPAFPVQLPVGKCADAASPAAGAVWCQEPPVSGFSLLSPLVMQCLCQQGWTPALQPPVTCPHAGQGDFCFPPSDKKKMTATEANIGEKSHGTTSWHVCPFPSICGSLLFLLLLFQTHRSIFLQLKTSIIFFFQLEHKQSF